MIYQISIISYPYKYCIEKFDQYAALLCIHSVNTLNICMKKFDAMKKLDSILNLAIFFITLLLDKGFVGAEILHAWRNQLSKKFDAIKILFDKMTGF